MFRRPNYSKLSDEALMAALQKGRRQALEELYLRYQGALRHYFYRMTGQDEELARDLCQDLFVRVAERAATYQSHRRFRTWLYSIAHNLCKNHYRHRAVVENAEWELQASEAILPPASILERIDAEMFRERINATLLGVDPDRRSVFLLRHREGLSLREIAEIQDCPVGTVKSRLHYVHRYLAHQLSDLKPELLSQEDEPLPR